MSSFRIVVLASGGGTNLQAILDQLHGGEEGIEVVGVGSDKPDAMALGRGIPWTWNADRDDVRTYLLEPERLAELARIVRDREGSISAGARAVGVDRQTFVRVLEGKKWSQYGTQLKVVEAAGVGVGDAP